MMRQQGFTLIELVMVIVIIGILSAVAIPQFIDMRGEARQAAVDGLAGALGSASAINYAATVAGSGGTTVGTCTDVAGALAGGASSIPAGYTISGTLPNCTITHTDSGVNASFIGHAATAPPTP